MEKENRSKLRGRIAALAATALLCVPAARAEETAGRPAVLPMQNLSTDAWCENLEIYHVTFRDPRSFDPEAFSDSRIGSIVCDKAVTGPADDVYTYYFFDGGDLVISGPKLTYAGPDAEDFRKLMELGVREEGEIAGFPLDWAQELCGDLFDALEIRNMTAEEAYLLHGRNIEAYYLTYRQEVSGGYLTGAPQARILMSLEGVVLLELDRIVDREEEAVPLAERVSVREAADLFAAAHQKQDGGDRPVKETYEISRISLAYCPEYSGGEPSLDAELVPCWRIDGRLIRENAIGTRVSETVEYYRIADGEPVAVP